MKKLNHIILLLVLMITIKFSYGLSTNYFDSLELRWIYQNAKESKKNEVQLFHIDYNDCFNCNLLINHLLKNEIDSKTTNLNIVLTGVPSFKIIDFKNEYKIPDEVLVFQDNGIFSKLGKSRLNSGLNGRSGYYRIFNSGFAVYVPLKELSVSGSFNNLNKSFVGGELTKLEDKGEFFTDIEDVFLLNKSYLLLTNPNKKLLKYSYTGNLEGSLSLNDTQVLSCILASLNGKYTEEVLNKPQNSIQGILSNYKNNIKPLGFKLISYSSIVPDLSKGFNCLLYVRFPIDVSDSEMVLDNAIVYANLDSNGLFSDIVTVEIPKVEGYVINNEDGFGINPLSKELFASLFSIDKKNSNTPKIGVWSNKKNKYYYRTFYDLRSLDSSFYDNNLKNLLDSKFTPDFYILGDFVKFRRSEIYYNLGQKKMGLDNVINPKPIFRKYIGTIFYNNEELNCFVKYYKGEIFILHYSKSNVLINCFPIYSSEASNGSKFLVVNNHLILNFFTGKNGFYFEEMLLK